MRIFTLILYFIFIASQLYSKTFYVKLSSTNAIAGTRIDIKIKVLNPDLSVATDYCGYVKVFTDYPDTYFRGKYGYRLTGDSTVESKGSVEIFINKGTNINLLFYSFYPGKGTIKIEDSYNIIPSTKIDFSFINPNQKLLVSEVMFKTSSALLYLEIFNASSENIVLTNLKIKRYKSTSTSSILTNIFLSSAQKILAPQTYALISLHPSILSGFFPYLKHLNPFIQGTFTKETNNFDASSHIVLINNGSIEDICEYSSDMTSENASIERTSFLSPAYLDSGIWKESLSESSVSSLIRGTPGIENGQLKKNKETVNLQLLTDKKIIKKEDLPLKIICKTDTPGIINLSVFDSSGIFLKYILREISIDSQTEKDILLKEDFFEDIKDGIFFIKMDFINYETGVSARKTISFIKWR